MFVRLKYITVICILLFIVSFAAGCCCCCCSDIFGDDDGYDSNSYVETPDSKSFYNTPLPENTPVPDNPGDSVSTLKAVLVVCDDYINDENNGIAVGIRQNHSLVTKLLDRLEARGIMPVERVVLKGKDASSKNILNEIEKMKTDSDDVFLFYYNGHGGMTGGQTFLWPCDETDLFRSHIQEVVNAKNARFKMIITDSCSSSIDSVGYKNLLNYMGTSANMDSYDEYYRNLFLNYRGLLDYTAATEGQYAWYDNLGGYFTVSLVGEVLLQRPLMKWEDVIRVTGEKTEDKFAEMYNMGFVSQEDIDDMREQNITNQSPQVYSMPYLIDDDSPVNTQTVDYTSVSENVQVIIANGTGSNITFYVDDNADMNNWNEDNCQEASLSSGEDITLTNPQEVRVFYDKGNGDVDYYTLETGNYYFDYDGTGLVDLYIGTLTYTSSSSNILIYNFNYFNTDFTVEYGGGNIEKHSLKPNECSRINTDSNVNIYFEDTSYVLDVGETYYFSTDAYNRLELYLYK